MNAPAERTALCLVLASTFVGTTLSAQACSSDAATIAPPSSSVEDASSQVTVDAAAPLDGAQGDASAPAPVTFTYRPQWTGVKSVVVIGGFGTPTDWSAATPLLTLVDDGSGTFAGKVALAPGQYPYVLRVLGDAAAATPATYERYVIDPANPAFVACPAQSPTYTTAAPNPCSQLAVPAASAAPLFHVRGIVTVDGSPASGYLVQLDRQEAQSHHFFVNRVTAVSDGAYDLLAAPGHYRLQILHPTFLSETDEARSPATLAALRRAISASFAVSADSTVNGPDVAFHAYGSFAPAGDAGALPTDFRFEPGAGTRLDVYGTAMDGGAGEIGDPWFTSSPVSDGGAAFDGAFDTKQATDTAVQPGKRYFWGTERVTQADAGVAWTAQSMVLPITWP